MAKFTQDRMFEMLGDIVKPGKKKHAKTFRNNGDINDGGPTSPEEWRQQIKDIERQIGNPSGWTLSDYNTLQNKLNEYKSWRENTPEGQAVIDYHNQEGEYKIPLPEHLQDYTNAVMKSKLAYANEFGNPAAKRMINIPDNPYQFDNGDTGTHYMASYDNYAVPQIQDENGVLQLGDYGPESNEAIRFDSDEDANYFAENYKNVSPGFLNQKQYGGLQKFVVGGQPPCGPGEAPDPKTGLCTAVAMTQNLPEADVYSKASTRKLQGTLTDKLQQMRNAFQNSRASNMKDGDKYNFGLNLGDETNDVRELPGRIERYRQAIELEKTKFAKDSYTLNQLKQYDPAHWDLKDQSKRFQRKPYEARSAEGLAALRSAVKSGAMSQEDFNYAYNDWGKNVDQNAVQGTGPGAGYNSKDVDWDSEDTKKFTKGLGIGVNALTLGMGAAFAAPIVPMALEAASSGITAATPLYEGIMSTPILGTAEPAIANAAPITNMIRTALTGNNLAKAYGITKSSYDLLSGSTYDANKKVVTDAAKGEFNIGNVATALGKDLGLVSTVSNFIPQVNTYAGYIPKGIAKVGTGHSLESPYSVNTVIKGVIDANKKLSGIAIKQEGGALLNKKVTCKSCGWQWDAADGGNDVTTCHKCGGQGLVHAQYGGLHKFVGGGDPGDGSFGEAYRKAAYGSTFWWNGKRFKKDLENDNAAARQRVIDKNPVFWNHVKNEINASNKDKYDNRGNLLYVGKDLENYNTRSLNDRIDLHIKSGNPNITIGNPNSPFGLGRAFFTNDNNTMNLYGWDEDTKVNSSLLMDDYREELLHARQLKDWGIERFNEHQMEDFDRHNIYWDPVTETWINYKENYDSQMYDDPNSIEGVHNAQSEGLKSRLNRNFDVEEKNDINNKSDRLYNITPYITGEKSFDAYENQGDLRQLQKVLDEYGYDLSNSIKKDGTYDGIYGEETKKAFEKYKKDYQQGQLKPTINQKNDIVPNHLKDKNAEAYVKTLPKDKEVPKKISTIDKTKSTLFKLGVRSWNSMKYGGDVLDDNERLHKFVGGGPTDCKQGEYWNGTKCVPTYGINPSFSNNALTNNVNGINTKIAETKKKGMVYQSTADELNELYKQKADEAKKEAKRKELEAQERQRQQQLRTVGSDNTRVDNSITKNYNANYQLPYERAETITKAQKDAARQIVLSGDFGKYFPEQMDYYLSTENSHRQGGPLTLEELALQEIRTNPDFFQILEEKKYQDFQKREQKTYDNMPWYMKGINTVNALASDPLTTLERGLLEWERPLAFQGLQSTDPSIVGDDARFYDRALNRDENFLNNTLNYINPFRAASSAGQNLQQGDYGDAVVDFATIIPMLKAGKYGMMGLNGLMKFGPETIAKRFGSNIIANSSPFVQALANKTTVGNLLTLYGGYEAGAHNFPNAYDAYSKGDWKTGNKELFMGVAMGTPIALEMGAGKAFAKGVQGAKGLYNDVATGNSFIPYAWKNPAAALDAESSTAMFDKIIQSDNFTNAEKALIKEYQYSSTPFVSAGAKQDQFNALIQKATLEFPNDAVITRAFAGARDFDNVVGTAGDFKSFSLQGRPSAFSAGTSAKGKYYYANQDRIVLSGKNLKKLEGNFVKNNYEALPEGYYSDVAAEDLAVIDHSKQLSRDIASGNRTIKPSDSVGDSYYGTSRLSESEIAAQAEAVYAAKTKHYSNLPDYYYQNPDGKVFLENGSAATSEEAVQMAADHNLGIKNDIDLFTNPARKEEALQLLIKDSQTEAFSANPGPISELELMGSGFDLKTVGKFKNKHGGIDYVVQPRNIKTQSNNTTTLEANSSSKRIPYNAEKNQNTAIIIEQLRYDRYLKINSPEGKRRIEELIANNPHMKNMTYEDVKNGFANMINDNAVQTSMEQDLALLNQRIKNLEANPNANQSQIKRLKKQAESLQGNQFFGEQKIEEKTLGAVIRQKKLRTVSNKSNESNAINLSRDLNPIVTSPSDIWRILASPELTVDDLARIVPHEFGHYFQQGAKTHLDEMLSKISLKTSSSSVSPNLFSNDKGISRFYNSIMKRNDPFYDMSKYWRTGSNGREKTAFMEEVRADMLQRGMIKDLYQTITPELLQDHYLKYMGEVGNKFPLRIYEIMNNNSGNFNIMSEVLNKMPAVVPIGVGGAGMMMMQNNGNNNAPKQKYGGNVKTLSKFIKK